MKLQILVLLPLLYCAFLVPAVLAAVGPRQDPQPAHDHGHESHADGVDVHRSGMKHDFSDADKFAKAFDGPERVAWQKPDHVVALMAIRPGMTVVDLGAAPGGWSQIAAKRVGAADGRGKVIAIDLLEMPEISGVTFAQLDFLKEDAPEKLLAMMGGRADVVLSDMAANTTGHRKTDQLRILGLVEGAAALPTAKRLTLRAAAI